MQEVNKIVKLKEIIVFFGIEKRYYKNTLEKPIEEIETKNQMDFRKKLQEKYILCNQLEKIF